MFDSVNSFLVYILDLGLCSLFKKWDKECLIFIQKIHHWVENIREVTDQPYQFLVQWDCIAVYKSLRSLKAVSKVKYQGLWDQYQNDQSMYDVRSNVLQMTR